jgi:hypothetical protein
MDYELLENVFSHLSKNQGLGKIYGTLRDALNYCIMKADLSAGINLIKLSENKILMQ